MSTMLTDQAKRLLAIEWLLRRTGVPVAGDGVAASPATFKRDLRLLRSELGAVIVFDHYDRQYRLVNRDWRGVWPHIFEEAAR